MGFRSLGFYRFHGPQIAPILTLLAASAAVAMPGRMRLKAKKNHQGNEPQFL
jgi:hypothetical protein